jgi:hypothetical protein
MVATMVSVVCPMVMMTARTVRGELVAAAIESSGVCGLCPCAQAEKQHRQTKQKQTFHTDSSRSLRIFLRVLEDKPRPWEKVAEYAGGSPCPRRVAMAGVEKTIRQEQRDLAHVDQDSGKGAVEPDGRDAGANTSMEGQQGHRADTSPGSTDSDFPEPGGNPEHSGGPVVMPVVDEDETVA